MIPIKPATEITVVVEELLHAQHERAHWTHQVQILEEIYARLMRPSHPGPAPILPTDLTKRLQTRSNGA